jgi:hypothetical protein
MVRPLDIVCFVEDAAHESFIRALLGRLAREESVEVHLAFPTARGGRGRALSEFRAYQRARQSGISGHGIPDLLVIAVDCDCQPPNDCAADVIGYIDDRVFPHYVGARPRAHIEEWYQADPETFQRVVDAEPVEPDDPCEPGAYKRTLEEAVRAGGNPISHGGAEFAPDLVAAMDLNRAARRVSALGQLIEDLKAHMRRIARELDAIAAMAGG